MEEIAPTFGVGTFQNFVVIHSRRSFSTCRANHLVVKSKIFILMEFEEQGVDGMVDGEQPRINDRLHSRLYIRHLQLLLIEQIHYMHSIIAFIST